MSTFPQHWREVALRHISVIPIRNGIGEAAQDQEEGYVRYIRTTDIADLHRLDESKRAGVPLEVAKDALVADDDILMTAAGSLGTSYLANVGEPAAFAGYLVRWRVDPTQCDARYFAWWTSSRHHLDQIATGAVRSTIDNFNASKFRSMRAPLPPLNEQRAIADFLDRETAQIDAMIEAQEELVKALTARRALSITNAVSFGLDSAGLQDTGVPWLGQAPAHWEVRPLKHLGRAIIGLTYAPENIVDERDDSTLVLRAGNIQGGRLDYGDCVFVDAAIPRIKRLRDRDLLICTRNGSARLIGKSALIHGRAVGQTWGAFMAVFRSTVNDYLYWVLNSALFERQLGLFATSTINQLTTEMLHNMRIAVPPRDEQVRIITHIETAVAKVDDVLREAERTVSLLRERREALISAAVTGRIDPTTGIERIDPTTEEEAS